MTEAAPGSSFDDLRGSLAKSSPQSASVIVPMLQQMVEPTSVIDIGCGIGVWLSEFKKLGVKNVLGLDSAEMLATQSVLDPGEVLPCDLASMGRLNQSFDLALCLEVAEHLPAERAAEFVRFLTTAAPVVVFSAAIPGQGGVGHVNEQWPGYWRELFEAYGYRQFDGLRSVVWNDARVAWWYRQNLFLYSSRDLVVPGFAMVEDVVHPEQLRWCNHLLGDRVRLADVPSGKLLRAVLGSVRRSVDTRVTQRIRLGRPTPAQSHTGDSSSGEPRGDARRSWRSTRDDTKRRGGT